MTDTLQLIAVAFGGGGMTVVSQLALGWWRTRGQRYEVDRTVDADLEAERGKLTLALLQGAREDAAAVREQTTSIHAVHLSEALDHLYALLNSGSDAERKAAERRARSFLRRMRPETGDVRNRVQRAESVREFAKRTGMDDATE